MHRIYVCIDTYDIVKITKKINPGLNLFRHDILYDFLLLRMEADFTSQNSSLRPICIQSRPKSNNVNNYIDEQEGLYYAIQKGHLSLTQPDSATNITLFVKKGLIQSRFGCDPKPIYELEGPQMKNREIFGIVCFRWDALLLAAQPVQIFELITQLLHSNKLLLSFPLPEYVGRTFGYQE